jgi:hypothetical protein
VNWGTNRKIRLGVQEAKMQRSWGWTGLAVDYGHQTHARWAPLATNFNAPIGIDSGEQTSKLILSINYPSSTNNMPWGVFLGADDENEICTVP